MDNSVLEKYKIDFNDTLKSQIIDAAVKVYGEPCRSAFEERINKILLIQYITPDDLRQAVNGKRVDKSKELTIKFLEAMGIEFTEDNREIDAQMREMLNTYFEWNSFNESKYTRIFAFENQEVDERTINRRCEMLRKMGADITPENYDEFIESEEGKEKLREVERALQIIKGLINEWDSFKASIEPEEKYMAECENLERDLSNEGIRSYYENIKEFLTETERSEAEMVFMAATSGSYSFFRKNTRRFFPSNIFKEAPIEAFLEEYTCWDKERKIIDYFKSLGLDLGDDYSKYADSEDAKRLTPDLQMVKQIREARIKNMRTASKAYFLQTGTIKEDLATIKGHNLLGEVDFSMDMVEAGATYINPNVEIDLNGNAQNINLMFFPPLKRIKEYGDVTFIHEVLHALEGSIEKVKDGYIFSSGFEKFPIQCFNGEINVEKEDDKALRQYEIFSENIHQRLAMDVTQELHKNDIFMYKDTEQKLRGGTSYEHFNCITSDFYSKFRNKICYARVTGGVDRLRDSLGQDQFNRINDLVKEFGDIPYYSMMRDVIEKKDTPLTQKRTELIKEATNVVLDMEKGKEATRV